jgi:predicted negative regulator of RcsB-dependent stress response
MSTYQTEDEQVEAIKKWWKENGKSVVGGIVIGFAIIGGWQGWQGYQRNQGEAASANFEAMRMAIQRGATAKAMEDGKRLIGEHGDSAYSSFAALQLAKLAYQRGEKAAARDHLRWVADSAPDPALRELARLRLGRLLLDMEDLAALQALLGEPVSKAFAGEFAVLRGDLANAQGNLDAARTAYLEALATGVEDADLLRMKLVDVGGRAPAT